MQKRLFLVAFLAFGCDVRETRRGDANGLDGAVMDVGASDVHSSLDTSMSEAGNGYAADAGTAGCEVGAASCTPVEPGCQATEICDDGIDNDCNRLVDDHCTCVPGEVQSCFFGPPGSRNVGACRDGTQRCEGGAEFGLWGPCEGGISPGAETCDRLDNDCNGCVDEHDCCGGDLSCPGPLDPRIPSARPFDDVSIDGTSIFSGPAVSWAWSIRGGPCDAVVPVPTYTLGPLDESRFHFTPSLSGDYTITMRVRTAAGEELVCTFVVHVAGEGLRVELCWARADSSPLPGSDLDLYLHTPGTMTPWFNMPGPVTSAGVTAGNSCNWANCAPGLRSTLPRMIWGHPNSLLDHCDRGPAGAGWTGLGYCPNPRIDVDGHGSTFEPFHGVLENLNTDTPADGQSFRVMVHDCSGPATHPVVNVYCGGFLRATLGAAPDLITLPGGTGCSANLDTLWRVADVVTHVDAAGVTTDCDVTPIRAPGGAARLTRGDLSY